MSGPAERIRLRMEGQPQEAAEGAALLLTMALKFCAQPDAFPAFLAFVQADAADTDWVLQAMGHASPELLRAVEHQIAAGVVADFEEAQ